MNCLTDQSLRILVEPSLRTAVTAIEDLVAVPAVGLTAAGVLSLVKGANLDKLAEHVRRMADYAHNAVAEYQNRGEQQQALIHAEQASRYEHLEYIFTHESVRKQNADRLISGLRRIRHEIDRNDVVKLHGSVEAKVILTTVYGEPHGAQLLNEITFGLDRGSQRHTNIRNIFTLQAAQTSTGDFTYTINLTDDQRLQMKDILSSSIKNVRDESEAAKQQAATTRVSPTASRPESDGNNRSATLNSAQESRTEGKATIMATATVVSDVTTTSAKKDRVRKSSTATKTAAKSKAAAKESVQSEVVSQNVTTQSVEPSAETSPQTNTPTADQVAEQAAEKHWTKWREAPEKLSATLEAQARGEYAKWAEKNTEKAKEITFEKYRDYRIEQSTKNELKVRDEVEQVAASAGAPTEKSWRLQTDGYKALSESHKEQAQADYAKFIEKNPNKASMDIEQYCSNVQEYSAKDKAIAKAMLVHKGSVDKGSVNLSSSDQAHHFLSSVYKGERTGNDALGALRTSVEPGSSKSITLKNTFTLSVERSANNSVVRTTLQALPGKEGEVKKMFDQAASNAFRRAGYDTQNKSREQSRKSNDLGR